MPDVFQSTKKRNRSHLTYKKKNETKTPLGNYDKIDYALVYISGKFNVFFSDLAMLKRSVENSFITVTKIIYFY